MKICFTSDQQNDLESTLSYHFGHCPYFVYVEIDGNEIKNVYSAPNELAEGHNVGDLPTYMKQQNVDVIITGGMGPRAQEYFEQYGIKPVIGAYGKVKDVLEEYLKNKITYSEKIAEGNLEEHTEGENEEIDRLKKDIVNLRQQIADMKSIVGKLNKEKEGE
ncbi:MAG: dinitrogenase iron-molybdenum cofactor [Proteobacteria bacterium]|nr:dinitrogenase iron-molybdenum cofactor [Pseudomonadota bacterium]